MLPAMGQSDWFRWEISQSDNLTMSVRLWPIKSDPTAKAIYSNLATMGEVVDIIKEWYTTLKITPSKSSQETLNWITRDNLSKKRP